MTEDTLHSILHLYRSIERLNSDMSNIWNAHIVFTWRWYLSVGLLILPWAFISGRDRFAPLTEQPPRP